MLQFQQAAKKIDDYFIRGDAKNIYKFVVETIERPLIENTLDKTGGNQLKAARILGINRNTLHSKIKKLHIEMARWRNK